MAKSTLPTTMRAWNFSTSGAPNQILSLNPAHPAPSPPTGSKLLVKVSYVGLTSAGINLMRDVPSILRKNAIPEGDFSGHVALAGPSAGPEFSAGTRVFGTIHPTAGLLSGAGTLAEYLLVPSELVQVVPSNVRLKEATALGGLAQTALKMVETAVVANGHRVLVHGASGGVGIVALQLAKARGAIVVATCSKRNFELVQAAGADEIIDYAANNPLHSFVKAKYGERPFDSILDAVGSQDLYVQCPAYLKPKGIYVNVGTLADKGVRQSIGRWVKNSYTPRILGGTPRSFSMFGAFITEDGVRKLAQSAQEGHLKIFIDSVFKLEDVLAAYERFQSKEVKGKVIVEVSAPEGMEEN